MYLNATDIRETKKIMKELDKYRKIDRHELTDDSMFWFGHILLPNTLRWRSPKKTKCYVHWYYINVHSNINPNKNAGEDKTFRAWRVRIYINWAYYPFRYRVPREYKTYICEYFRSFDEMKERLSTQDLSDDWIKDFISKNY
jgi:hypothetical protein